MVPAYTASTLDTLLMAKLSLIVSVVICVPIAREVAFSLDIVPALGIFTSTWIRSVPKLSTWPKMNPFTPSPSAVTTTTAKTPITTPKRAKNVRTLCVRMVFTANESVINNFFIWLFITQGFHRTDPGSFDGRIQTENDADDKRNRKTDDNGRQGNKKLPLIAEPLDDNSRQRCGRDAKQDADDASDNRNE